MPIQYNIPQWCDEGYLAEMRLVLTELARQFAPRMSARDVLTEIREMQPEGPYLASVGDAIIWVGKELTVGGHALLITPPHLYFELFPSAARVAIEVFEKGHSGAEDGLTGAFLSQSLSVRESGSVRVYGLASAFDNDQKAIITRVLRLISRQGNEIAAKALEDFWGIDAQTGGLL